MPLRSAPSSEPGTSPDAATAVPGPAGAKLREAIRATLAQRAGSAADANAVAKAALEIWAQMAGRLAVLVGVRGVEILFGRALHLASARYPWLEPSPGRASADSRLAELEAHLAAQDATVAAEGAHALLVTFAELLASLIGEALTARLLGPIWAIPVRAAGEKAAP